MPVLCTYCSTEEPEVPERCSIAVYIPGFRKWSNVRYRRRQCRGRAVAYFRTWNFLLYFKTCAFHATRSCWNKQIFQEITQEEYEAGIAKVKEQDA